MKVLLTTDRPSELDEYLRALKYSALYQISAAPEQEKFAFLSPIRGNERKEEERRKEEIVETLLLLSANSIDITNLAVDCEEVAVPCDGDVEGFVSRSD